MKAVVSYQLGVRIGEVTVDYKKGESNDLIIKRAKIKVNEKFGPMMYPTYYESWHIVHTYKPSPTT